MIKFTCPVLSFLHNRVSKVEVLYFELAWTISPFLTEISPSHAVKKSWRTLVTAPSSMICNVFTPHTKSCIYTNVIKQSTHSFHYTPTLCYKKCLRVSWVQVWILRQTHYQQPAYCGNFDTSQTLGTTDLSSYFFIYDANLRHDTVSSFSVN